MVSKASFSIFSEIRSISDLFYNNTITKPYFYLHLGKIWVQISVNLAEDCMIFLSSSKNVSGHCLQLANAQFHTCSLQFKNNSNILRYGEQAVARLLETLCYKPHGRGFDFRWGPWIFFDWPNSSSCTTALGVDSASNRNEYQKCSWR
jgi:hypothetical protein